MESNPGWESRCHADWAKIRVDVSAMEAQRDRDLAKIAMDLRSL